MGVILSPCVSGIPQKETKRPIREVAPKVHRRKRDKYRCGSPTNKITYRRDPGTKKPEKATTIKTTTREEGIKTIQTDIRGTIEDQTKIRQGITTITDATGSTKTDQAESTITDSSTTATIIKITTVGGSRETTTTRAKGDLMAVAIEAIIAGTARRATVKAHRIGSRTGTMIEARAARPQKIR